MTTSHDSCDISADSVDALIARLTSTYIQPSLPTPAPKMVKVVKKGTSKLAQVKADKVAQEASAPTKSQDPRPLVTLVLPTPPHKDHHLSPAAAKDYMVAMSRTMTRDERILTIAAYIGYDVHESYGSQELAANMAARRTLKPVVPFSAPVGSAVTLRGYVSGIPDMNARRLADLQGRQQYAVEEIISLRKQSVACMEKGDTENATHFATMAALEEQRLHQIRTDLATLQGR
jgi:hypothetical protein